MREYLYTNWAEVFSDVEISVLKVNKGLIRWDVSTGLYIAKVISSWSCKQVVFTLIVPSYISQKHSFEGKELGSHFLRKVLQICGFDNLQALLEKKEQQLFITHNFILIQKTGKVISNFDQTI